MSGEDRKSTTSLSDKAQPLHPPASTASTRDADGSLPPSDSDNDMEEALYQSENHGMLSASLAAVLTVYAITSGFVQYDHCKSFACFCSSERALTNHLQFWASLRDHRKRTSWAGVFGPLVEPCSTTAAVSTYSASVFNTCEAKASVKYTRVRIRYGENMRKSPVDEKRLLQFSQCTIAWKIVAGT